MELQKITLLSVWSLCTLGTIAQNQVNLATQGNPECVMLTISGDAATQRAVSWRTDIKDTVSVAEIIEEQADPTSVKQAIRIQGIHRLWEDDAADYKMGHKVFFNNLKPATRYLYRVGNDSIWSEWHNFTTASAEVKPFSFLYFGDVQNDIKELGSRVLRQSTHHFPNASFLLFAGDLVGRSTRDYWDEFFYAGSYLFSTIPSMPIAGNHEYYPSGKLDRTFSKHWNQIYTLPDNAPCPEYRNRLYYVDYQGVRFVGLDAFNVTDKNDGPMIMEWLEKTLSQNPCKWTILFVHYPIYSCSQGRNPEGYRETLKPVLEKYGVDLVLQGHDHTYCRGYNDEEVSQGCQNPPLYVVSVAGPKMYGLNTSFWGDRMGSLMQLYQHISIDGDTLLFESYDVTGQLYDAFTLQKRAGKANLFTEDSRVQNIPMNTSIPDNFKKKYTEEEMKRYQERFNK